MSAPVLEVADLTVAFGSAARPIRAVSGVSFALAAGRTMALLGESGSGKSVTLRALMRLLPPRATLTGEVRLLGQEVLLLPERRLADLRGKSIAMVFQEPGLAFDPVYRVGDQIVETIRRHEAITGADARTRARGLFERVRIPSPERRLDAYPHELSGGMRQRAMIALALACRPAVLLADEPTTALDATVQIQVLLLLRELQRELGMGVVFVTHDVGVAAEIADDVAVMYAGRLVETGSAADVLKRPRHPYTRGLLASTVHGQARGTRLVAIPGAPPDLAALPPGCAFAPRCAQVHEPCTTGAIALHDRGDGHAARCVLAAPGAVAPPVRDAA